VSASKPFVIPKLLGRVFKVANANMARETLQRELHNAALFGSLPDADASTRLNNPLALSSRRSPLTTQMFAI